MNVKFEQLLILTISLKLVLISPGAMAFTLSFFSPHCGASALTNAIKAALLTL